MGEFYGRDIDQSLWIFIYDRLGIYIKAGWIIFFKGQRIAEQVGAEDYIAHVHYQQFSYIGADQQFSSGNWAGLCGEFHRDWTGAFGDEKNASGTEVLLYH